MKKSCIFICLILSIFFMSGSVDAALNDIDKGCTEDNCVVLCQYIGIFDDMKFFGKTNDIIIYYNINDEMLKIAYSPLNDNTKTDIKASFSEDDGVYNGSLISDLKKTGTCPEYAYLDGGEWDDNSQEICFDNDNTSCKAKNTWNAFGLKLDFVSVQKILLLHDNMSSYFHPQGPDHPFERRIYDFVNSYEPYFKGKDGKSYEVKDDEKVLSNLCPLLIEGNNQLQIVNGEGDDYYQDFIDTSLNGSTAFGELVSNWPIIKGDDSHDWVHYYFNSIPGKDSLGNFGVGIPGSDDLFGDTGLPKPEIALQMTGLDDLIEYQQANRLKALRGYCERDWEKYAPEDKKDLSEDKKDELLDVNTNHAIKDAEDQTDKNTDDLLEKLPALNSQNVGTCSDYLGHSSIKGTPAYIIDWVWDIVKIVVIMGLIILSMFDLFTAITNNNEMNAVYRKIVWRLGIVIVILLLPTLIELVGALFGKTDILCGIK